MSEWKLQKSKHKNLLDELVIKEVHKSQYSKLSKFHYIQEKPPAVIQNTFGLFHKDSDVLYGIIIFSAPSLELLTRNKTIVGKILGKHKRSVKYGLLNKNCIVMSRVVVHPSLRGIGASSFLIENTWRKVGKRFVEITATMLYYRNFLPKSYSYFLKYSRVLSAKEFLDYQSKKGQMIHRAKSPVIKYGYGLFINENIKFKR